MENKRRKLTVTAVIIGICYLVLQHAVYLLGHEAANLVGLQAFCPKIPALDDLIPICPIFIVPYAWSYVFWCITPMVISLCDREHFRDYLMATLMAMACGFIMLVFLPTYMDRNAEDLLVAHSDGFFEKIRVAWYAMDGGEMAYNLLPSFHCINSTLCYLGGRKRAELPRWYRIYSLVITVLIYAATCFVKQHYVADVISGILVAVVCFIAAKKWHLGRFLPTLPQRKKS